MIPEKVNIGLAVRAHRKALGLTQRELGEETGISLYEIISIEIGRRSPLASTLAKLCAVFGGAKEGLLDEAFALSKRNVDTSQHRMRVVTAAHCRYENRVDIIRELYVLPSDAIVMSREDNIAEKMICAAARGIKLSLEIYRPEPGLNTKARARIWLKMLDMDPDLVIIFQSAHLVNGYYSNFRMLQRESERRGIPVKSILATRRKK